EADVVNTAEIFPLLAHVCVITLLAGSDGQVQVTITEVDVSAATPPDLGHPEHVFVEGRNLLQVVGGQGYMFDFCHVLSPRDTPVPGCVAARLRPQSRWVAIAAGDRSIACDSADRQSRHRAVVSGLCRGVVCKKMRVTTWVNHIMQV